MKKKRYSAIVIGGGGGGLAAAIGLAETGFQVNVLEACSNPCQKQSGLSEGGQGRRHGGAYYAESPRVANTILQDDTLVREHPDLIVQVTARYFVPESARAAVMEGWRSAGVRFEEGGADRSPLSRTFCHTHEIVSYVTQDQVIDTKRLRLALVQRLVRAGGELVCNAEVIDAEHKYDRIMAIHARTAQGSGSSLAIWSSTWPALRWSASLPVSAA